MSAVPVPANDHPSNNHLPVSASSHSLALYNPYAQQHGPDDEIDLRKLWRIISKYRWTIVAVFLISVLTTLIASLLAQPVYRATVLIEVQPSQQAVKFKNLQQTDSWDPELLITQTNILLSESVAESVVDELTLAEDPEFNGEFKQRGFSAGINAVTSGVKSAIEKIVSGVAPPETVDESDMFQVPPEVSKHRRIVKTYQKNLTVDQVANSDLLTVSFDSFSPRKAATIANAHTRAYLRLGEARRFNSTAGAKTFLTKQIADAQAALEASDRALTDIARKQNIVDVEDRSNLMAERLTRLSNALTKTRQDRIIAEVTYRQAERGELESIPAVLEGALIKELREDYATMEAEYKEKSRIFKSTYPKMQQLAAKMENLKATLDRESGRLVVGLRNQYEQLLAQENQLTEQVKNQQEIMFDLKDRAVQYNILKREWEANKELFAGLLDKQKDVRVAAGLEVNNISIVDDAAIPVNKHSPKTKLNVAVAGVIGLVAGLTIAFLLAFLDNTIKTGEELEHALGIPFLGMAPLAKADKNSPLHLLSANDPVSAMAEAVRSIRTSILFSRPDNVPKKLLFTSTTSGEGKSTIAMNLSLVLAQNGSRVLIMEADLRKPNISKWLGIASKPGLVEYLGGNKADIVKATSYENVYCIPAGSYHPNPAELLGSVTMSEYFDTLCGYFDFVIIDGPPVLGLADSLVLSSNADGVVMIVKSADTEKDAVKEAVKRLRTINAPLVGSVLNYVDFTKREYGYYQSYYYSHDDGAKRKRVSNESVAES